MTETSNAEEESILTTKPWIRGVNIGGWLVLERYITPYLFSITDCHLSGEFCSYPGQISPLDLEPCNLYHCKPVRTKSKVQGGRIDYPFDEYTLMQAFPDKDIAKRYLNLHYNHFVTRDDIETLAKHGVTHVRVPLGHWILGDVTPEEPYVHASGWLYFVRLVGWCRSLGIQVWPDLHTAPGSQNGFDNSGQALRRPTCFNWYNSTENVDRTVRIITKIAQQIRDDGLSDVVTGLGLLNEPFEDCDFNILGDYYNRGLAKVRSILGNSIKVYISDMFHSDLWNNVGFWQGREYQNTFLDSHAYHVFSETPRSLSPRQHIAYVCRKQYSDLAACCYDDWPSLKPRRTTNTIPATGISRFMGEWTASFDTLVSAKLSDIMDSIAATGEALELDREIPLDRQEFLRRFVEAQMVSWEGQAAGLSQGWFFWTFKMEGSAFAEWDFLRGLSEGWIPSLPPTDVGSQDVYGACEEIIFRVNDTMSIVKEFPDPTTMDPNMVHDIPIDDDVVVSHGESLRDRHGKIVIDSNEVAHVVSPEVESGDYMSQSSIVMCLLLLVVILGIALKRHLFARSFVSSGGLKHQYEIIGDQA